MQLSIMLPGLTHRPWRAMASELRRQAECYPNQVEVLVDIDDGEVTSGVKRQRLLSRATGTYVAFVDDDDELHTDYIRHLLLASQSGPDVVTFNLEFIRKAGRLGQARANAVRRAGVPRTHSSRNTTAVLPAKEIWRFCLGADQRKAGRMTANHLCAWRRELATQVAWCPAVGYADDQLWYGPLVASGLVRTEVHVDLVLYRYLFNQATTVNQQSPRIAAARAYVGSGLGCFWHEDEIVIEVGQATQRRGSLLVRDRHNQVRWVAREALHRFHTIHIK